MTDQPRGVGLFARWISSTRRRCSQSGLREQEWVRQQGEARLRQEEARFAEVTGTGNAAPVYCPTQPNERDQLRARCQAQKNYRDATLRQVGLNRTFDLIRQLDELVYEACKGL